MISRYIVCGPADDANEGGRLLPFFCFVPSMVWKNKCEVEDRATWESPTKSRSTGDPKIVTSVCIRI